LHNSMNALVQRMTARRIWQLIYSQLGLKGSVDVNHFKAWNTSSGIERLYNYVKNWSKF